MFRLWLAAVAVACCAGSSVAAGAPPLDLTKGASTVVPASMNPGVRDAFGNPYEVRTRVTAVRFHDGTKASTAPGGLGTTPHPVRKTLHGVTYWQVTGELSGIGHSPVGFEYVYGPIDAKGVDQSANPSSPRYGLRGITFRLLYPATGWNGHLVVYRNGGDGGTGSGHYLYQSVTDEIELVRRGYAYFVTLGGGTTPFDSNPDSASGLFWKLAPPYWAPSGPLQPNYFRAAAIGSNWSEGTIPDSTPGLAWFRDDPEPVPIPIGSSDFVPELQLATQDDVPTFRDHINAAKNMLQLVAGSRPTETGVVAWSRSGNLAIGMDFGRTPQADPSVIAPAAFYPDVFQALTPRTGGDYNTPYEPRSGRVVDWFVVRSGNEGTTVPLPPDGRPDSFDMLPDPEYPVAAPFVYVAAEIDLDYIQLNPYYFANVLSAALPGSKVANKDLNAWLRLYTLRGATHQPHEAWFAGPSNGGNATWYEPRGAGYNTDGKGLELPAWIDTLRADNPDLLDDSPYGLNPIALFAADTVSEEGFSLQAILNADRWAAGGPAPPTSAVDRNLAVDPTPATRSPSYPVAQACKPDDIFGSLKLTCLNTLTADSLINDPGAGFEALDDFEIEILREFAAGPLQFTTDPIDLPDEAAPLGYRLFTPGPALLRPFRSEELRSRYGTHVGYVAAVRDAVSRLVARGLYDPAVGALDVARAERSSVLR